MHKDPVPPRDHNPDLPEEYAEIFKCALAKTPDERFATFSDFVAALNLEEFDRLELPRGEATVVSAKGEAPLRP